MNARLAEIARNLRRRGSPAIAVAPQVIVEVASPEAEPQSEHSDRLPDLVEAEVEVGARAEPSALVTPGAHRAIEIASSGSKEASGEVARVEGEPSKSKKHKPKDATEEEENTKKFQEQVTWWKQVREDFKTSSSRVAEMDGEQLNPDWVYFIESSCVAICFFGPPLTFNKFQASTFGHNLALKCLMFRNDKADAEKKIRELEQSLESTKAAEKEALEAKAAADGQGRTDGFSTGRLAGKTEGVIEGRETFLQSNDYKQSLANARLQGARYFLKSPIFKTAVDVQSAQFLNDGFDKCIAQVVHLQGFAEGFDQSRLDSSLDGHLQPYPPEDASEPSGEDEFATLINEIGYVP
ncbi:hypothetical protein Salat_2897600 [Sesamum alatum]|uniref:Uncharacterized protein n=1 Tax=Sesamum alatum TaxID=300844 RepID=A0AAE2C8E2_9LAMI|nr:hypothetical protein Salat_2897600 [Sesamum alatum]